MPDMFKGSFPPGTSLVNMHSTETHLSAGHKLELVLDKVPERALRQVPDPTRISSALGPYYP